MTYILVLTAVVLSVIGFFMAGSFGSYVEKTYPNDKNSARIAVVVWVICQICVFALLLMV